MVLFVAICRINFPCRGFPLRPVLPAKGDIALVTAELDLRSGLYDLTIEQPSVISGLPSAPADGFDLLYGVGQCQEPMAAFKQITLEVGAQAIADDGNILLVHDIDQLLDLALL